MTSSLTPSRVTYLTFITPEHDTVTLAVFSLIDSSYFLSTKLLPLQRTLSFPSNLRPFYSYLIERLALLGAPVSFFVLIYYPFSIPKE